MADVAYMIDTWKGQFGDEYTDRWNTVPDRGKWGAQVLPPEVKSVFEIGCNVGANLLHIRDTGRAVSGCDLNHSAVVRAKARGLDVFEADGLRVDAVADLVFTVGGLIHLRTPELIKMLLRMRLLARDYVLLNEYYSKYDVEVPYREKLGMLWKRDYGAIYQAMFSFDTLVASGENPEGFDRTTWWMFQK